MVGQYAFAAAVGYPLSLLANLQLRAIFVNDHEGRYPFDRFLGLRYLLVATAWLGLLGVCLWMHSAGRTVALVFVVGTSMLIDSLSESYYSVLQKSERMDRIGRSQIFRSCLGLGLAVLALLYTHDVVWAATGMLVSKSLVFMQYDTAPESFRLARISSEENDNLPQPETFLQRFRPNWDRVTQWRMFWEALPIGAVSVLVSLNINVPRYIIEHYLGAHELGIYSALSYVPQAGVLIASALGYVTYARFGKLYFQRDIRGFKLLLLKNILICAALGFIVFLVSAFAGRTILGLLYRPEYAEHWQLFLWLVATAAIAFVASCFGYAITAASQFVPQLYLFMVVLAVSSGAAFVLVPRLGLYGAVFSTLASIAVQFIGTALILRRALKKRSVPDLEATIPDAIVPSQLVSES